MSKEPTKNKKDNDHTWSLMGSLLLSIAFIGYGIIMIANGIYRGGISSYTLKYTATGGELLILVGLVFLYVCYHSISPYSKFRQFFEGKRKQGNNKHNE